MAALPKRRGQGIRPRRLKRTHWFDPEDVVLLGQVAALRRMTPSDVLREAVKAHCTSEIAAMGAEMARAMPAPPRPPERGDDA